MSNGRVKGVFPQPSVRPRIPADHSVHAVEVQWVQLMTNPPWRYWRVDLMKGVFLNCLPSTIHLMIWLQHGGGPCSSRIEADTKTGHQHHQAPTAEIPSVVANTVAVNRSRNDFPTHTLELPLIPSCSRRNTRQVSRQAVKCSPCDQRLRSALRGRQTDAVVPYSRQPYLRGAK